MKKKRLCKVWSERHLPEGLLPEILSRLPVKSLLRFRCVSKSWHSMISDPDFRRLHLKNFKKNRDETHLFVVEGREQTCFIRRSDTFAYTSDVLLTIGSRFRYGSWQLECSIDGLVLLKNVRMMGFNDLMLWNVSMKKFHFLPSLPETAAFPVGPGFDVEIGLGYDPLIKDYKHVKLIFANDFILQSVAIYTLGVDSWKIIPFKGNREPKWRWVLEVPVEMKAIHFRGSLYFFVLSLDKKVLELISFDLSSEVFSCTSLPKEAYDSSRYFRGFFELATTGSSLTMFDFAGESALWVLKISEAENESNTWTEPYMLGLTVPAFLYLKKNGDILIWWGKKKASFRLATGEKVGQRCGMVSSFNLESEEEEILLLQKGRQGFEIHDVCGYVESLNLLDTDLGISL